MHSSKLSCVQSVLLGHCFVKTLVHSVRHMSWKHWPIRLNGAGLSYFLASDSWVKIFDLKSGSMNARKYLGPNHAWLGATCLVISFVSFSNVNLIWSGCFMPSSINLSGMPSAPKEVQQVYQVNRGVCWTLMRSDSTCTHPNCHHLCHPHAVGNAAGMVAGPFAGTAACTLEGEGEKRCVGLGEHMSLPSL